MDLSINSDTNMDKKSKIGICLSGGGALGFAHLGVLKALEDNGIYPDEISGSSMGSIIGVAYAAGYTPMQMLQFITEGKLYKITRLMNFKPNFWNSGFANHLSIINLMHELFPNNSTYKLEKKLHVCVSNITTGNWEIISETQKLDIWIAASCSIPGIFKALKINDMQYVDGGLLNNMPAQALRNSCSMVIGSDVTPHIKSNKSLKSRDTFVKSLRLLQHQNAIEGRKMCDFLIEPLAIEKFNEFNYDAFKVIYQYGYEATKDFIDNHPEILKYR